MLNEPLDLSQLFSKDGSQPCSSSTPQAHARISNSWTCFRPSESDAQGWSPEMCVFRALWLHVGGGPLLKTGPPSLTGVKLRAREKQQLARGQAASRGQAPAQSRPPCRVTSNPPVRVCWQAARYTRCCVASSVQGSQAKALASHLAVHS